MRDRRLTHRLEVRGGVLADECAAPLEAFFARQRRAVARRVESTVWVVCMLVGKLPHGGVSERPKEHASKACDG